MDLRWEILAGYGPLFVSGLWMTIELTLVAIGAGLLLGIKCRVPNATLNAAFRDQKLLAVPAGENVIRLLPPLIVSDDEIRDALNRIRAGAKAVSSSLSAAAN